MSGTTIESQAACYQNSKAEEMLKFFFQLVDMTKHMVDDLLPDILMGIDRQTLEQVIRHCEEFNCSFQVFVKLCGVISRKNLSLKAHVDWDPVDQDGLTSAVFVSSDTHRDNPSKDKSEAHEDPSKTSISISILDWAAKKFDDTNTVGKFYYCGLCDVMSPHIAPWKEHCQGAKHLSRCKENIAVKMACDVCGLHLLAQKDVVAMIIDSPKHQMLDENIARATGSSKVGSTEANLLDDIDHNAHDNANERKIVRDSGSVNRDNAQLRQNNERGNTITEHQGLPSVESKTQNEGQKGCVFEGKAICPQFVKCSSKITSLLKNNEAFAICYCRPCDVTTMDKASWGSHCQSAKHQSMMNNKLFNNVICACLQCQFGLVASKTIALCYMHFHIEKCHGQSTVDIVDEEYMEMKELFSKARVNSSQKTNKSYRQECGSFKGSTETVNSSRPSSACSTHSVFDKSQASSHQDAHANNTLKFSGSRPAFQSYSHDNTAAGGVDNESRSSSSGYLSRRSSVSDGQSVRETREGQCSPNSYESQPIAGLHSQSEQSGSSKKNQTSSESTSSGTSHYPGLRQGPQLTLRPAAQESAANSSLDLNLLVSDPCDPVGLFTELLKLKESKFLMDRSFKPFSALCLICKKNVLDLFQWYDHISTHESNNEQNEVECSQCNTFLFGNVREINRTLIPLPYHVTMDDAMAR